jgi:hypothetical protein
VTIVWKEPDEHGVGRVDLVERLRIAQMRQRRSRR